MSAMRWTLVAVMMLGGRVLAGPYDAALRFLTHRTPHFQIHYHQGEDALASRLASIAETTHVRLSSAWGLPANRTTHVVLVDQTDLPNGSATVVPWNAIVIYPVPPSGAATIGNTDDWLEYVFTHEYAHILHLDRSRGWARLARGLFGRSVIAFPNLTLPLWQIEGIATLTESEGGAGRLHAGDFREVVDTAARTGRLEPLDRVNGGLIDWPSGQGWYAYGARFHQYLVRTYGPEKLRDLSDRTAGRLPFLTAGAFRRVYGKSMGQLWSEFRRSAATEAAGTAAPSARAITRLGFLVDGAREAPDGSIYFTATDAHRFPGIYRLTAGRSHPERVVSRYGGEQVSVTARDVLFDQLEIVRGAALVSDLYLHDMTTGKTRRLTREGRLSEADRSPDGARVAAVQVTAGARQLVILDATALLAAPRPIAPQALPVLARDAREGVVYATPRWSPDGHLIAVERRRRGGPSTIVVLDGGTLRQVSEVEASAGGRVVNPAWSVDGASLFFAACDGDASFEIRAVDLGPGGRITTPRVVLQASGGARAPLPTRAGRLVFVGYTTAGSDLFEVEHVSDQPADDERHPERPLQPVQPAQPAQLIQPTAYRPFPTFVPRGWLPEVESRDDRLRIGGSVVGIDVLARHVMWASATWAVTTGAVAADLTPKARPDWDAAYTYQRWQPAFYVAAQDRTSLFDAVTSSGRLVPVAQREQTIDVGVWRPFRRVRWTQTALAAYHVEELTTDTPATSDARTRAGIRTAWTFTSARRYGYSISQEDGMTMAVTGEFIRPGFGADAGSDAVTADVRAYVPMGVPHAVLAARVALAASTGDDDVQRRFRLGGSDGNPSAGAFGSDAISLLRGFQDDVFVGDRVALLNIEARVPLLSVQRGWGTWPLFVRRIHAAAFTDIGHAWDGTARWADRKIGYGVELSADVVAGFGLPLTWTAGMGWGRDGADTIPNAREFYFRVGRSF